MRDRSTLCVAGPLAALLLLGGPDAASPQTAVPGAPLGAAMPAIEERAAVDSFLALVPLRARGEIDLELERSAASERSAANRRRLGDRDRRRAREAREEQDLAIDRAVQAIRIAEDLGQDDRKDQLKAELELRRRYREVIDLRIEVLEQGVISAEQEERLARAVRGRLLAERDLSEGRAEWRARTAATGEAASGDDRRAREARLLSGLAGYLEARVEEEREIEKLARTRQALIGKRIELVERRRKLFDD